MNQDTFADIWNAQTGIVDLTDDWRSLGESQIEGIRAAWGVQRERLKGSDQLNEFTKRLSREWAIETGIIENLYDIERGVTQTLIECGFRADLISHGDTNKPREFVLRLLNDQQDALEGVFAFIKNERSLSTSYIKELHAALTRSQEATEALDAFGRMVETPLIRGAWKTQPNYPMREGVVYRYCPPAQVASEMDRLVFLHLKHLEDGVAPEVEAAWLHHKFTQIHPFQDGNGRVARALASLVLVRGGLFPLVVTRDHKNDYLDTLEKADEGDLRPLIRLTTRLQLDQFNKATQISQNVLTAKTTVQDMLSGLRQAAARKQEERTKPLQGVFITARKLEDNLYQRINELLDDLRSAISQFDQNQQIGAVRADENNSHYFRYQIVENAKNHLNYYANTIDYRSWVGLSVRWRRKAWLVFAFHGSGRDFNGSLVCAPFMEFKDMEEDGQFRPTLVPVADEPFEFFYNETENAVLERFQPWRERVLTVALKELAENL